MFRSIHPPLSVQCRACVDVSFPTSLFSSVAGKRCVGLPESQASFLRFLDSYGKPTGNCASLGCTNIVDFRKVQAETALRSNAESAVRLEERAAKGSRNAAFRPRHKTY